MVSRRRLGEGTGAAHLPAAAICLLSPEVKGRKVLSTMPLLLCNHHLQSNGYFEWALVNQWFLLIILMLTNTTSCLLLIQWEQRFLQWNAWMITKEIGTAKW
ncbi:unnamed protein product [Urochloa humidicola]